jgi:hypothetical protein
LAGRDYHNPKRRTRDAAVISTAERKPYDGFPSVERRAACTFLLACQLPYCSACLVGAPTTSPGLRYKFREIARGACRHCCGKILWGGYRQIRDSGS